MALGNCIALCLLPTAMSSAASISNRAAQPTVVTVTAGKPSEHGFTISPKSVKRGTVLFKLIDKGKLAHGFEIDGHATKVIRPNASATLTVKFKRPGKYVYQCVTTAPPPDFGPGYNDVPSDCGGGVLIVR